MYISHVGSIDGFFPKLERHLALVKACKRVFVCDGAKWIWKWVEAKYPESIQILDFYHAKEHLCQWAEIAFRSMEEKSKWIDYQSLLLLNDKVEDVIKNISKRPTFSAAVKEKKKALINYYSTHKGHVKDITNKICG